MLAETIELTRTGFVGLISMIRPKKRNAISTKLIAELRETIHDLEADDGIRVIVITGSEAAFCAGADISEVAGLRNGRDIYNWIRNVQKLFIEMEDIGKPIIAAVNGVAMGGGMELSMACDLRYAAEGAIFGVPEINIGVLPAAGGMSRLPRLVGLGIAKELIYTGRRVTAEEAIKVGLVNKVFPDEHLLDEVIKIAEDIASKPPITLAVGKSTLHQTLETDIKTAADIEAKAVALVFDTEDRQEGMKAFLEKRAPSFQGR
ncbi:MAG: enoyl-CoA hydratase/isomerase family protein [Bacillota bacterium]